MPATSDATARNAGEKMSPTLSPARSKAIWVYPSGAVERVLNNLAGLSVSRAKREMDSKFPMMKAGIIVGNLSLVAAESNINDEVSHTQRSVIQYTGLQSYLHYKYTLLYK